jgi:predicted PhzF superfamily epimerase YddE/YHI9
MAVPIYVVDAFTDRAFGGNPAGVCLLDSYPDDAWMQSVAAEMRHAETAFLVPQGADYQLRWFTPTVEVDLCGHATLASAHTLFERGDAGEAVRFHTRSGILTAARAGAGIELDFPAETPHPEALPFPPTCLGEPVWTGRNRMDWFVQLSSAAEVRALQPDFTELAKLGLRGLIVTARDETGEYDFVSRGFFPQSGVDEDPVTGSAHCAFAPFWAERLGKTAMTGYQASPRGGVVGVEVVGDRVKLRGRAVTVLAGSLTC